MGVFVSPVICMLYEEFCGFHDEALDGGGLAEVDTSVQGYKIIKTN